MKPKMPKDMTPSPKPWKWYLLPSGGGAVVKGSDNSVVCTCHPSNAKEMCGGIEPCGCCD